MHIPFFPIASITQGPRQSNFELLRIVAMFLVLMVHSDFWSLGNPKATDFISYPANAFLRTIIESISIVCVNVFILISGWFDIKFSIRGLSNFIFQCIYFLFGTYAVLLILGITELSIHRIAECFCLTKSNWFIKSYIGLYILSPVLNIYVTHATKRVQRIVLIMFFLFQTAYGWSNAAVFIEHGYSTFSFIGLYLLSNYVRHHHKKLIFKQGGILYILTIAINTFIYYTLTIYHLPGNTYSYVNPFVIIGALGILGYFGSLHLKSNKLINWMAKSSFAVYLFHTNPNIVPMFKSVVVKLYDSFSGFECIGTISGLLILIFVIAILIDQPRRWLWTLLSKAIFK